jgi:hypothetical protein
MVENCKYKVSKNIVFDTIDEETGIVIDDAKDIVYEVTSSVCDILKFIEKPKTFENIKKYLLSEYEVDEKTVEQDLKEILEDLLKNNVIEKV